MHKHSCTITDLANIRRTIAMLVLGAFVADTCQAQGGDLWDTIRRGQLAVIQKFLADGGDPNTKIGPPGNVTESWPLLQVALYDREEEIALLLLSAGARYTVRDIPLSIVAGEAVPGFLDQLLLANPTILTQASRLDQTSLLQPGAYKGYYQTVEVVLSRGRQLDVVWDPEVLTAAVAVALDARQDDIARRLLAAGASPEARVLTAAARASSPGVLKYLLSLGADPKQALREGEFNPTTGARTALDFAWRRYNNGNAEERLSAAIAIQELIRAGATLSSGSIPADVPIDGMAIVSSFDTPAERIVEAARLGYYDVVSALVGTDIDPDSLRQALMAAFSTRHNDIARLLLNRSVSPKGGPLHAAAAGNSPGLVRRLLELGADANEKYAGRTPVEFWWERARMTYLGAGSDYVLHELIKGGADACWLTQHTSELSTFAETFLRNTAAECWPATTAPR